MMIFSELLACTPSVHTGKEMYTDLWPRGLSAAPGSRVPVLSEQRWRFDDQYYADVSHRNLKVGPGGGLCHLSYSRAI